jgi:hypothetical protein
MWTREQTAGVSAQQLFGESIELREEVAQEGRRLLETWRPALQRRRALHSW